MSTITVTTTQELSAALAAATGGETILLAPGDYGDVEMLGNRAPNLAFAETVTLKSADPNDPARITKLDLREASNITFDGLLFDYTFEAGQQNYYRPFSVSDSTGISILNSVFDGDVAQDVSQAADGYGYAIGLSFRDTSDVVVEGNSFFTFYRAATISDSSDVSILGNDIHDIRLDGLNFSEVQNVLIEGNHIHDFRGPTDAGDHSDMIQFWTRNTENPSTGITIRDNQLDIGDGIATHAIFMRNDLVDRGLAGDEMFYRDVLIEENTIVNAHLHGIYVGETDGLQIERNTVVHADGAAQDGADASVEIPRIDVAGPSRNVTIVQNITSAIHTNETSNAWTIENNAFVQDQNRQAAGYYEDVFLPSSLSLGVDGHHFIATPGGVINTLSAGAAGVRTSGEDLFGHFSITQDANDLSLYHFAAAFDPAALTVLTHFQWSFGDGTTASGTEVSHSFEETGDFEVHLAVSSPGMETASQSTTVTVDAESVLTLDPEFGFIAFDGSDMIFLDEEEPVGSVVLEDRGVSASVEREHVTDILGAPEFSINLSLDATHLEATGDVFRLHSSILTQVDRDGDFVLRAWGADGERIKLTSDGVDLADLEEHDVSIRYDDATLELWIDGALQGAAAMSSGLASVGRHDLVFGNPWGKQNFESVIDRFDITLDGTPETVIDDNLSDAGGLVQSGGEGAGNDNVVGVSLYIDTYV